MGTYSSGELGLEATAALPQLVLGGSLSRLSRLLSAPHHGTRVIFDKLHIDHREVDVAVRGRLAREMQNPSLGNDKIFPLQVSGRWSFCIFRRLFGVSVWKTKGVQYRSCMDSHI